MQIKKEDALDLWEAITNYSASCQATADAGDEGRSEELQELEVEEEEAYAALKVTFVNVTGWSPRWDTDRWIMESPI